MIPISGVILGSQWEDVCKQLTHIGITCMLPDQGSYSGHGLRWQTEVRGPCFQELMAHQQLTSVPRKVPRLRCALPDL